MRTTWLERIVYFQDYVVVEPGDTPLKERQLLTEDEFRKAKEQYKLGGQYNEEFRPTWGPRRSELLLRLDLIALSDSFGRTWLKLRASRK